jgi:hypothetical protein
MKDIMKTVIDIVKNSEGQPSGGYIELLHEEETVEDIIKRLDV